jgi:hypothetical protein
LNFEWTFSNNIIKNYFFILVGGLRKIVQIPAEARYSPLLYNILTGCETYRASYSLDRLGSFPRITETEA